MLNDRKANSTPEKICDDFRKFLRERATNHSQFYRRLSATPAIKRLLPQRNISIVHMLDNDTNNTPNSNEISLASKLSPLSLPIQQRSQSMSLSTLLSSFVVPDNVIVNHQATTSNVRESKLALTDRYVGENSLSARNRDDTISRASRDEASPLSDSIDRSNDHAVGHDQENQDDADVAEAHLTGTGDANNVADHIRSARKAHEIANESDDNDVDSEQLAINNNNKTCEQDEWNRSNYLTFVRATSLDRTTHIAGCCYNRSCTDYFSNSRNASSVDSSDPLLDSSEKDDHLVDQLSASSKDQSHQQYYRFPCVENLVKMYTQLLQDKKSEFKSGEAVDSKSKSNSGDASDGDVKTEGLRITSDRIEMNRNSPLSDEGCPLPYGSPYSSDCDDNDNDAAAAKDKEKVLRSSSSDSALGLDDEAPIEPPPMNTGRRMTLTVTDIPLRPALLPVAEPITLPDSTISLEQQQQPGGSSGALITQTAIPSKVILEERIVEIPEDKFTSVSNSRRESAQSCLSDYNSSEYGGVRYVRTPSVVVSDYSDDVLCGITLEEIEYFRAHRMRRRSSADTTATEKDDAASDVSAASSCSNLYYCGSTISALDGADYYVDGVRMPIDRKISDCSTCSTVSGDDDDESYIIHEQEYTDQQQQPQPQQKQQPIKKHQQKKVRHPKVIN